MVLGFQREADCTNTSFYQDISQKIGKHGEGSEERLSIRGKTGRHGYLTHAHRPCPCAGQAGERRGLSGGDVGERAEQRAGARHRAVRRVPAAGRSHPLRAGGNLPGRRRPGGAQADGPLREVARHGGADDGRAPFEREIRKSLPRRRGLLSASAGGFSLFPP